MTTSESNTSKPITKSPLFWGCIILLVLSCLAVFCLSSVAAVVYFTNLDNLETDISNQFDEFLPENDFLEDEPLEEPVPDDGSFLLFPYLAADFPFQFSYPSDWEIDEQGSENVSFSDPDSNTELRVGRDWLCNGCQNAADAAMKYSEVLEFQAELDEFLTNDDTPFEVVTGDDAHFTANEWFDTAGDLQWSYHIHVVFDDYAAYIIMEGDDYEYFVLYRDLFLEIGESFDR